jgi:putative phosphoesterase
MVIAVISDSHDNIWKIEAAATHLQRAQAVLHCGDLCSPFVIKRLVEAIGDHPLHIVWGNNDGDRWSISRAAAAFPNVTLHGMMAQLEMGGVQIAMNHYPEIARDLASSGSYDMVCYGHDHSLYQADIEGCLLLNPGELMGMNGRSTIALVDLPSMAVQILEV